MIVSIGQEVIGKNGKLGTIYGLRMDSKSQTAEEMVIQHGFPLHDYRMAVLGFVTGVRDGIVELNINQDQLGALEQYDPRAYHSADADAGGSGSVPLGSHERWIYGTDETARNATNGKHDRPIEDTHPMAPHYPTDADIAPEEHRPAVVSEDTLIWDNQGQKLGQVQSFAVETSTGMPKRLSLKRGFLSQPGLTIPLEWVAYYGTEGIVLRVGMEKVQALITDRAQVR